MALTSKEISDARERIERAARPLVFYDDDADGLTSYLMVKHFNPNAIGIRVARGPELNLDFVHRVDENMPDLILVLDKPRVTKEFFERVKTPTIWIDHHGTQEQKPHTWKYKHLTYLNPRLHNDKDRRPVSYWVWKITKGQVWLAAIGTTADWHEDLLEAFSKEYPKLAPKKPGIAEALYNSKLGLLVRIYNFILKGASTQVQKNINAISHVESPEEIIEQKTPRGKYIYKQYMPILSEYLTQRVEAKKTKVVKGLYVHVFTNVKISLVAEVANEMLLKKNAEIVLVGRKDQGRVKFSIRSHEKDLTPIVAKALEGVDGYGGGHREACGGSIVEDNWERFVDNVREQL